MSFKLFKKLLFRSTHIQREIESEQGRKWPDQFRLLRLKKLRLAIKDKLMRLARKKSPHMWHHAYARSDTSTSGKHS